MRDQMTAEECADILRASIRHRERMHKEEIIFVGPDESEYQYGKINSDSDDLYHAMKFALDCVEEECSKGRGKFAPVRLSVAEEPGKETNDRAEVVCKQSKGISEKHKKYLKRTLAVLIGFLLGMLTRLLFGLLLQ